MTQDNIKYPFLDLAKVNEPWMDEMAEAARRVVLSGRYVGGKEVADFEAQLAQMLAAPHVVGVSNGIDALRLIFKAYVLMGKLQPGDEVIVPANTYIASVLAITDAGLVPVLAEPDPNTLNLDTARLEEYLTPKTRALMPVHLYGRTCWDASLVDFVKRHNLLVVEDAAQSIGSRATQAPGLFASDVSGALGHAAGLSFYPTKNVGALGDAGAVATNDPELAKAVKALANYGSDTRYHNIYRGYNCRLDPIQAAMMSVKLPHTAHENALRFKNALAYQRTIDHPLVTKPLMSEHVIDNVWHQYIIRIADGKRDAFQQALREQGVATDIHYAVPPHLQPCYANTLKHTPLPITEQLAGEVLSLPIARGTSVADAAEIARIINRILL